MKLGPQLSGIQSHGEDAPYKMAQVNDFGLGMNKTHQQDTLPEGQFEDISNLVINRDGKLEMRERFRTLLTGAGQSTAARAGISTYTPDFFWIGDSKWAAMFEGDGARSLEAWDATNKEWEAIYGSFITTEDMTAVPFGINDTEDVIFANGADTPVRWSGEITAGEYDDCTTLGLAVPITTGGSDIITSLVETVKTANEDGIDKNGFYYYRFTYYYEGDGTTKFGESGPDETATPKSEEVTVVTDTLDATITITPVASTVSGDISEVRVYRSPVDQIQGPYRYVGKITSDSAFVDSVPNGQEGVEMPIDAGTPPKLKYIHTYDGRLLGFDGDVPNKIVYSEQGQPDYIPALNYHYLPDDGKGWGVFNKNLYVFTSDQTFVFPNADVTATPIKICDRGCAAPKSIVDVGTGLMWVGPDTVYWADFNTQAVDGDYPVAVGEPVRIYVENASDFDKVTACLHKDKYYLSLGFDTSNNNTTLTYNVPVGTRIMRQGMYGGWSRLEFDAGHIMDYAGTLYHSNSEQGWIYEHGPYTYDYWTHDAYAPGEAPDGTNDIYGVPVRIATGYLDFGNIFADKLVKAIKIQSKVPFATLLATVVYDDTILKSRNVEIGQNPDLLVGARWGRSYYAKVSGSTASSSSVSVIDLDGATITNVNTEADNSHEVFDYIWIEDVIGSDYGWGTIPVENFFPLASKDTTASTVTLAQELTETYAGGKIWYIGPNIALYVDKQDMSRTASRMIPESRGKQVKVILSTDNARQMELSSIIAVYKMLPHSFG